MPSTIVKLSSSDARVWAHNQPLWLDERGEVARAVTRAEQHAIGKALERTRRTNQSFRMELALVPQTPLSRRAQGVGSIRRGATPARVPQTEPIQRITCAFEVSYVGAKRVVTVFYGRLRYATGREVLAARLLADHGECVVHGRNGKCIGVLRDPLIQERPPSTGRRVQFSRNPDDAKRAEEKLLAPVSPMQRRVKRARHSGSQAPTYSPAQCPNDCRGLRDGSPWALAKGVTPPADDEHHPVCKFAAAWSKTLAPVETTDVLYDLELSIVARAALPNEVAEAIETERRTGARQVEVAGRLYAVLSAADAERAALEARGEEPPIEGDVSTSPARAVLDGEPDDAELVVTPPIAEAPSSADERDGWPTLDPHGGLAADRLRQRTDISARDYLARSAPEPHSP